MSIFAWDNSFAHVHAPVSAHTHESGLQCHQKPRRLPHREGFSLRIQRCLAWHPGAATEQRSSAARAQRRMHVSRAAPASAPNAPALDMIDRRSQHGRWRTYHRSVGVCARVRCELGRSVAKSGRMSRWYAVCRSEVVHSRWRLGVCAPS